MGSRGGVEVKDGWRHETVLSSVLVGISHSGLNEGLFHQVSDESKPGRM